MSRAKTLGRIIRRARKEQMMTQRQLADACGTSTCAISWIERDMSAPDEEMLRRLSAVLLLPLRRLRRAWSAANTEHQRRLRDIVDQIVRRRVARGISRKQLAEAAGVTYEYLCMMENRGVVPHPDVLYRIAEKLDMSPDALFQIAGIVPSDILERIRRLNVSQLRSLRSYLRSL